MDKSINIGTKIDLQDLMQSRLLIQANSGGGKSVLARVIIENTFGIVPFIVMDIEGEYYTLKEKYGDILIIGGQHADIPISLKSVKLLPKEIISNRLSVVIDLSDLQMSDRILYAKYFLETMMDLNKEYWINYLVFIEEAHKLCGEQDKQASATAVKDLMSRGRKRGYCGVLLTQRISKLHKDAAAECNNKFIGRTFLDIDLDRAAKELGLTTQTDKNLIRNLEPGNFYAFGTSIEPHQVHNVKINLPKTKIPKAGVNLDIKPQKPTEKIKAMLTKLNELPQEAEKQAKSMNDLQKELVSLKAQLKNVPAPSGKEINQLKEEIKTRDMEINELKKAISIYEKRGTELSMVLDQISEHLTDSWQAPDRNIKVPVISSKIKFQNFETNARKTGTIVQKNETKQSFPATNHTKAAISNNGKLGKCSFSILQFLASFPDRGWTKAQIGIATNYSPGSGGFNNSLSELTSANLILREDRIRLNPDGNYSDYLGDFHPQQYSIETFKSKLGKCEREIYEVLLAHPNDIFNKETLAAETESNYSYTSGGFNNALSTLTTLELIKRSNGRIQLNPELLEL